MPHALPRLRRSLVTVVTAALAATPLTLLAAPSAQAASTGVVISEVFGGNGATNLWNQDYVELHNPSAVPVDITGWSVQYRAATSSSGASSKVDLSGTIPPGGHFLVGGAVTTGGNAIPTPDAANTGMNLSGTAGVAILSNQGTLLTNAVIGSGSVVNHPQIVDLVGFGSTANVFENAATEANGPAPAPSTSTSIRRTTADADDNSAELTTAGAGVADPTNAGPVAPAELEATDPGDKTVYVDRAMSSFTLQATGGTPPYAWSATGQPAGVTVGTDGLVSGTPSVTGTFTVDATVTDGAGDTASTQFALVVTELPVDPFHTIPEIQGTGDASPFAVSGPESNVSTEGVVTARYPTGGLNGFYIQTPGYDPANDATPDASDAIFVYQGSTPSYAAPAVGDFVTINSGKVTEFSGLTEITVTNGDFLTSRAATPDEAVVPHDEVPGTDCELGECPARSTIDAIREAHEGEAVQPTGPHTVTDSYSGGIGTPSMRGEFKLAANSTEPLYIPLEKVRPSDTAGLAAYNAYNDAHGIVLDDGATTTYSGSNPYPWFTLANTVRAGAAVEQWVQPFVLDYRFGGWRLQPSTQVPGGNDGRAWIRFEQDRPAAPDPVLGATGNLKIATFNMLNYFVHAAQDWEAGQPADEVETLGLDRDCSYYSQTGGQGAGPLYPGRVSADECSWTDTRTDPDTVDAPGPRGAAQRCDCTDLTDPQADFERQEAKEVRAINTMDADVVSLEEVENPIKIGYADRDAALERLVEVLNADWATHHPAEDPTLGPRWAYAASPRLEAQPTIAEQDAIRSAFIYNPRTVETVGRSQILVNSAPFRNAREPLAQAFRHVDGEGRDDAFLVIVNHFKSKSAPQAPFPPATGDNADTGNGAGSYNGDRVRQAKALDAFAQSIADDKGIGPVFLTGDFNAYSAEDPVTTLEDLGWHGLAAENGETSYFFGGLAGSLDHVFANDAAQAMVTGQTVWPINANEPVYYEYSRYKYNATLLYDDSAFRASDHNPELVGITAPTSAAPAEVDTVQVLAANDFHGRLLDDPASAAAGAAALAGAVKELRADNDDTLFAMAGDIIGASTFESFIQDDQPTLDALNAAGLDVSSAGNHEFDRGYDDLVQRVMSETGADWPYLAANVRVGSETGPYALGPDHTAADHEHSNGASWWKQLPGGRTVGFVGAVTEDLPSLVSPDSLTGLEITDIVTEVNAEAERLKTDGCDGEPCDVVVELVHEGSATPDCDTVSDPTTTFGALVTGASDDVDAIVSGHTHLKYNCKVTVPGWAGRAVTKRPVVSAGQYGSYLNRLQFDFAPGTDDLVGIRQHVLALKDYDPDGVVAAIVDDAVDFAAEAGQAVLGEVSGPFYRARRVDELGATVENRGGESTLGNLVAEIQRWKTGADIGVMNPGGLRADLVGTDTGPGPVTYREAADVQPFANTLMTTELTGAQLKLLLEQQWQRDPDGNVPSRPFLRLGTSAGFTFTEDASRPEGDRITGMWLDGDRVSLTSSYTVAANSFIMSGGDNFRALTLGADTQDTGFTDLQATVDYLGPEGPTAGATVPVDFAQHGVGVDGDDTPTTYAPGDEVTFAIDSWSMTGEGDEVDTEVEVTLDGGSLGTFPVTTALPTTPYDVAGLATVTVTLPDDLSTEAVQLVLTGATTGTVSRVDLTLGGLATTVSATAQDVTFGDAGEVVATVAPLDALGTVEVRDGDTLLGWGSVALGSASVTLPAESLAVGTHTLDVTYVPANGTWVGSTTTVDVTVVEPPASATVSATADDVVYGQAGSIVVGVDPAEATGTVRVTGGGVILGTATLDAGSATVALAARSLEVGTHTLTVDYLGDGTYPAASTTVEVTVVKAAATVTATGTSVQTGDPADVAVTVLANGFTPTGTVQAWVSGVQVDSTTLSGTGTATLTVGPFATTGDRTVQVRYLGDGHTSAGTGTATVQVTPRPMTDTSVAVDVPTITFGRPGMATVTVTPATATGTVTLSDDKGVIGTATLAGGQAQVTIPGKRLKPGTHTVVAAYSGDATHSASQGTATVKVEKQKPKVKVTEPTDPVAGKKATFVVRVSTVGYQVKGQITLKVKGDALRTARLEDGKAVFKLRLAKGKRAVTVKYLGNATTTKATEKLTVRVARR